VPYTRHGNMLFFAGQLPMKEDGSLIKGRLGESFSVEEGRDAARLTALNILASLKHAIGDLDKVRLLAYCGVVDVS
jgi:enamine deaminase RidA (YjgF/YER057c/UK114 family)